MVNSCSINDHQQNPPLITEIKISKISQISNLEFYHLCVDYKDPRFLQWLWSLVLKRTGKSYTSRTTLFIARACNMKQNIHVPQKSVQCWNWKDCSNNVPFWCRTVRLAQVLGWFSIIDLCKKSVCADRLKSQNTCAFTQQLSCSGSRAIPLSHSLAFRAASQEPDPIWAVHQKQCRSAKTSRKYPLITRKWNNKEKWEPESKSLCSLRRQRVLCNTCTFKGFIIV